MNTEPFEKMFCEFLRKRYDENDATVVISVVIVQFATSDVGRF